MSALAGKGTGERAATVALLLFLLAFSVWAVRNYFCQASSDPATYLRFGESLAQGRFFIDYPPDRVFEGRYGPDAIYFGTYASTLIHKGRGLAFYAIGYPIYLALFILIGGRYAPFFANLVAFLALLTLLWAVTREMFREHPAGRLAALGAPALYVFFNLWEIQYFLAPYRDPLSHAFLLAALLFLLQHFKSHRLSALALSGFALGFAVAIRETSVLALGPLFLLGAWRARCESRGRIARMMAAFALGALLGVLPILVQNTLNSGNPVYPTQMLHAQVWFGDLEDMGEHKAFRMKSLSPRYFPETAPGIVSLMLQGYSALFIALLLVGLWAGRREPSVLLFLVPFVIVYTLFFGCYLKPMHRYIFVVQIALTPLIALAAAHLATEAGRVTRAAWLPGAAVAALSLGGAARLLGAGEAASFQVGQAEAFRRDFDAAVPAGALVFAERPMNVMIPYFTHAVSVRPQDFVREKIGLTFEEGLGYFARSFPALFFLDSADRDLRDGFDHEPVTRELLLSRYDLVWAAEFEAGRYGLAREFGRPRIALHRLEPRRETTVIQEVKAPRAGGGLLLVNGRGAVPGGSAVSAEIRLEERLVGTEFSGGLNWYPVPLGVAARETAQLRVSAGVPLPRDLAPVWYDADSALRLDVGPAAIPLDNTFLSGNVRRDSFKGVGRVLDGEAQARVPILPLPESRVVLAVRVQPRPSGREMNLECSGGGAEYRFVLRDPTVWRTVSLLLDRPDQGRATATVRIRPLPSGAEGGESRQPLLGLDLLSLHRLRSQPLPLEIDVGAGDDAQVVEGFFEPERGSDGVTFRWTNGEGRLRFLLSSTASGEFRLTLRLVGPPPAASVSSVRLAVNETDLGEYQLAPGKSQEISWTLPRGAIRPGLNELSVRSGTWRPGTLLDTPDRRTLGIMVDQVRLDGAGAGARGGGE